MRHSNLFFVFRMIWPGIFMIWLMGFSPLSAQSSARTPFDADADGWAEGARHHSVLMLPGESVLDTGDVVHTIPAPGNLPQGLTWDGAALWVSDITKDMIFRVDTSNGAVLKSFAAPADHIEGLAWDGTDLWAAQNAGGPGGPSTLFRVDTLTGAVLQSFTPRGNWVHGITWDGAYLWGNDFADKKLFQYDPATGQVLDSLPAPGAASIGLTWDGQYLWSDDFATDSLYQLDPTTGSVVRRVVAPQTNPRDLAFDGQYIWVLSWQTLTIYQVDVGIASGIANAPELPESFYLEQNYPNPFNPTTKVKFGIRRGEQVMLAIYDLRGKRVKTLVNRRLAPGDYEAQWNGTDETGRPVASGVYVYRLEVGSAAQARKMVLMR
ncbi:MAG: T9SS C-terminal target domain-containing protein [Calditrichaeota bacterium]|nr:MAG: T9SS C-terminal target domain-containing protein [Calditrichota bacterium]